MKLDGFMDIVDGERNKKIFTVEFDHDEVCITLVDEESNHEDMVVNAFDDIVFLRQWNEELNRFEVISISPSQWEELITSMDSPEGSFILSREVEE